MTLEPHLGGHQGKTHIDEGALRWLINNGINSFLDIYKGLLYNCSSIEESLITTKSLNCWEC